MRRAFLVPILALALGLTSAGSAQAAFYFSHQDGLRVAFRTRGHELVWANVVARLYCKGPKERRHFARFKKNYALPDSPWRLDRRSVFRWDTTGYPQEESFTQYELLTGHVGHKFVVGRFDMYFSESYGHRDRRCQTRTYPFGPREVEFRASRRRG